MISAARAKPEARVMSAARAAASAASAQETTRSKGAPVISTTSAVAAVDDGEVVDASTHGERKAR
jgi:hypothetical protein